MIQIFHLVVTIDLSKKKTIELLKTKSLDKTICWYTKVTIILLPNDWYYSEFLLEKQIKRYDSKCD